MPALQMSTIEDQLWTWVQGKSGLAADRVYWTAQNNTRPVAGPYITLNIRIIQRTGTGWIKQEDTPVPTSGNELSYKARNMQRCTLEITYWAGDPTGVSAGVSVLSTILESRILPSVQQTLTAVGIASVSTIQHFTGVVGSTLVEPRARVDVIFFAPSEVVETGTYVETVEITRLAPPPVKTWTI